MWRMTDKPHHLRRWIITVVLLAAVGIPLVFVGHSLYTTTQDRWAWRLADLDRNELHLRPVAESIEDGTVVKESSSYVVVRYSVEIRGWFNSYTGEFRSVCYHFPYQDPDAFRKVRCP